MQTTIANFVISNPANITAEILGTSDPALALQEFQGRITYDEILTITEPTLIYKINNTAIAWYDKNAMIGHL